MCKNNSVQNSIWLHVVSDKSEKEFPNLFFFFFKRSLPFLTEIAISKKQTTAMCAQEPRGPDHEVTLIELLQRRYGLNALVPPAMETEPS